MKGNLRTAVGRYMSYLLRHNLENLKINRHGFMDIDELLAKLRERFPMSKKLVSEIVETSERKRFEILGNKIRVLYGHTIPVKLELEEDKVVKILARACARTTGLFGRRCQNNCRNGQAKTSRDCRESRKRNG